MSCIKLRNDLDLSCKTAVGKYYQQIVLINKSDVLEHQILQSVENLDDTYECRHRIRFILKDGSTGFRFSSIENGSSIYGSFDKSESNSIPQYLHKINTVFLGLDEEVKCIKKQIDNSDYFAAIQYSNGLVEIYGFEFGLSSGDYSYNPNGTAIILQSSPNALEDEIPYIYESGIIGNENIDFDNNFNANPVLPAGDFNDDFSNDFYIE